MNFKEKKTSVKVANFILNFSNIILRLTILYFIIISIYSVYKIFSPTKNLYNPFYINVLILSIIMTIIIFYVKKNFNEELKLNISLTIFSLALTIYFIGIFFELNKKNISLKKTRAEIAHNLNIYYDDRTYLEVLDDIKQKDIMVFPNIHPTYFIESDGLTFNNKKIYPLGTISQSTTILGNETGEYAISKTDEYGFNNPLGLYDLEDIHVMLIGDSFTEGYSVKTDETIASILRKSNLNTISLGKGGSGPLIELSILKEYAKPYKPKIIIWLYYKNDLSELQLELQSKTLKKYLIEDNFSQNLISRQQEIDKILIDYANLQLKKEREKILEADKEYPKFILNRFLNILKLTELRKKFHQTPEQPFNPLFKEIIFEANKIVSAWGGKFYFVYLPSVQRYSSGKKNPNYDKIMQAVKDMELSVIDIHEEVFNKYPKPLNLYPFGVGSHYNKEGYKLIGEAIVKRLNSDQILKENTLLPAE